MGNRKHSMQIESWMQLLPWRDEPGESQLSIWARERKMRSTQFRKGAAAAASLSLILWLSGTALAQSQTTRIYGSVDSDVVVPTSTGVIGRSDSGALQEIQDYLAATKTSGCPEIEGKGTIQYAGTDDGQLPATLYLKQGTHFRLDITTSEGTRSTRISGASGVMRDESGKSQFLIPDAAITGLLQFQTLACGLMAQHPASYIDDGVVSVDHLHRITLESPLIPGFRSAPQHTTSVVDFYFDTVSHLLTKSVTLIRIAGARNQEFIRTITYSDYRDVSGTVVPFRFQESLNGEPTWSLQLNQVQLNGSVADSYFKF